MSIRSGGAQKRYFPRLAKRLSSLRTKTGESLQIFATRAGVSIPRLRDAECFGLATPGTLSLLAGALGVTVRDLGGVVATEWRQRSAVRR